MYVNIYVVLSEIYLKFQRVTKLIFQSAMGALRAELKKAKAIDVRVSPLSIIISYKLLAFIQQINNVYTISPQYVKIYVTVHNLYWFNLQDELKSSLEELKNENDADVRVSFFCNQQLQCDHDYRIHEIFAGKKISPSPATFVLQNNI